MQLSFSLLHGFPSVPVLENRTAALLGVPVPRSAAARALVQGNVTHCRNGDIPQHNAVQRPFLHHDGSVPHCRDLFVSLLA